MADKFQRIEPGGDRLSPATWNNFVDAARWVDQQRQAGSGGSARQARPAGIHLVKNNSGAQRERFDILGIDGVLITAADNEPEFLENFAFAGVEPDLLAHRGGKFVVCQEPIASGQIGWGRLTGATPCRVNIVHTSLPFADVLDADPEKLGTTGFGSARILYQPSGTGEKLCIVNLGSPVDRIFKGKTTTAHAKLATEDVQIISGSKGAESDMSGFTVAAYNSFADVEDDREVFVVWVDTGWELIAAEC